MSTDAVMMEANEVVRMVLADDLAMWIVLLLAIAGAVLGIMYLALAWSWRPRRKQRRAFGECERLEADSPAPVALNDKMVWLPENWNGVILYRRE